MKIHEYQAKGILREFGVPVPAGEVTDTAAGARAVAERLGGAVVVKAQIHAGGRGKGGGIKVARSPEEVERAAAQILGMMLKTPQTGPAGQRVKRILVEQASPIRQELYVGVVLDRRAGLPVVMASVAGGMEIEEVAAKSPEKILRAALDPAAGVSPYVGRKVAYGLGVPPDLVRPTADLIRALARAYQEKDCSLAEINPLAVTADGRVLALDAKMTFDDNALFRHPEILALRDLDEEAPLEVEASRFGLNYIKLDGTVGCMVNGAGLAMATMDIIKHAGGAPANFLDVGGGASVEQIENAFRILMADPAVTAVLINIFGGILRCDRLAAGVIQAARTLKVKVPIVIRMEGTNVAQGKKMLEESGLNFLTADTMAQAARMVVAASRRQA